MRIADRTVQGLSRGLSVLAALAVLAIMITMTADVLTRQLTGRSIAGAYELVESTVVIAAFLGLAYAERSDSNVRVRLVTSRLPARARRIVVVAGTLVAVAVAALMAFASWDAFVSSFQRGEVRSGLITFPLWPARLAAAVGLTAVALELALTAWRKATGANGADGRLPGGAV